MEALIAPRGLIVDLITPLNNDRSIDVHGLEKILDRVTPWAQAILLASPGAGEGENLNLAQRQELLEKALNFTHGRIPIIIWITQDTENKTVEAVNLLKGAIQPDEHACQVFWMDSPLYYHSNRGLPPHYQDMISMVDQAFVLHNDPGLTARAARPFKRKNIRTAILKDLCQMEGVVGLVFSGPLDRAHNYQRACRGQAPFRIYDGEETRFLDHPSMSGVISIGANLSPRAWQRITRSSLQLTDDHRVYPDHLRQIWELGQYLRNLKDIYHVMAVPIIKRALSDMGIIKTPNCTFVVEDVKEEAIRIRKLIARHEDSSKV